MLPQPSSYCVILSGIYLINMYCIYCLYNSIFENQISQIMHEYIFQR